jgi:uncharacterized protein (TIRG00374 family)
MIGTEADGLKGRRLSIALSVSLGIVLTGIWLSLIDVTEMLSALRRVDLSLIAPLAALFVSSYLLRSIRWKIILSHIQPLTLSESFHLCMINSSINFLVPLHGGELIKSFMLKRMKGTPMAMSLPSVYADKVFDLLPVFLLVPMAPMLAGRVGHVALIASGLSLTVLLGSAAALWLLLKNPGRAAGLFERAAFFLPAAVRARLSGGVGRLVEGVASLRQMSDCMIEIIALTIAALLAQAGFLWTFFYCFGVKLPVLPTLAGYILLNTSFILPAPPAYAGTLELSFVLIFSGLFGYDRNAVSAVAAASHLFSGILFLGIGMWSMGSIGVQARSVLRGDTGLLAETVKQRGGKSS